MNNLLNKCLYNENIYCYAFRIDFLRSKDHGVSQLHIAPTIPLTTITNTPTSTTELKGVHHLTTIITIRYVILVYTDI